MYRVRSQEHYSAAVKDSWLASLRSAAHTPSAQFVVDREGEMPEGAALAPAQSQPETAVGPMVVQNASIDTHASAPEPIKVTRQKKKGTGKKRTSGIPPPS